MKGSLIYFALVALMSVATFSVNAAETQCELVNDPDDCKNAAGCEYDSSGGGCAYCAEGHYCPNNGCSNDTGACACPAQFPNSTVGTQAEGDCYIPCSANSDNPEYTTENCGITKNNVEENPDPNGLDITCKDDNGHITATTTTKPYHLEGTNGCYLNTRPCERFTSNQNGGATTGDATWNNNNYNTSNCQYSKSESDNTLHCEKTVVYTGPSNVSLATDQIIYSQTSYYCTACTDATYYPTAGTTTEYPTCGNPESGHYKACSCVKIEKGYYNKNNTTWQNNMPITNVIIEACPMGQTTTSAGSNTCIYDSDTKICDSNGCTSLSNPSAWSPSN